VKPEIRTKIFTETKSISHSIVITPFLKKYGDSNFAKITEQGPRPKIEDIVLNRKLVE